MEEIKKMNIYEKLQSITNELGTISKNLNVKINNSQSYKAVSEKDVLDAIKPLEKKYRVYSYPSDRDVIDREFLEKQTEYKGKVTKTNTLFMRIETIYNFVNLDNPSESIQVKTYGDGLDTGDKAPGKAMTYADKYALMKAYKISTGDDPDKEASPEQGYSKSKQNKTTNSKTNYKVLLLSKLDEMEIDRNQYAKEHGLNSKTTQEEAKRLLDELKIQQVLDGDN